MGKVDRFAGLLLKASGASDDTFWAINWEGDFGDWHDGFFAHKTTQGADRELHQLHLQNPWIRAKAQKMFVDVEGDIFEARWNWFDSKSECQIAVGRVNASLKKSGLAAKAEVHQTWIYDHTSDQANPWIIWVRFWGRDVTEGQIARIIKNVL